MLIKKLFARLMAPEEETGDSGTDVLEIEEESGESEELEDEDNKEDLEAPDEVVISIGDEEIKSESDDKAAPDWVRELRKSHRELQKENRELKAKQVTTPATNLPQAPGKKPTLESCEYDTEKFEQDLTAWHDKNREYERKKSEAEEAERSATASWNEKLKTYAESKAALKVQDFDDAETAIQNSMSTTQQGIIVQGAENPALVIYAIGKSPSKAKELAGINDPVKFAFAIAKLETQLKVSTRKGPPPPEKPVNGNGRVPGSSDTQLDRLRAEAERTGDMTKVLEFKRKMRK